MIARSGKKRRRTRRPLPKPRRSMISLETLEDRRLLAGGDYSLDFAAAAPTTYDHATGGGAFNDGSTMWAVESLEGGDFQSGDIVSYFTKITVDDRDLTTVETIELEYTFGVRATNGKEVGHIDVVAAEINYGAIPGVGQGAGETDSGIMDDGGSTATITNEVYNDGTSPDGTYPDDNLNADELIATIEIDDLESGEMVILRIDVLIGNGDDTNGPANVQSNLSDSTVVASNNDQVPDDISSGAQTIPFKNVQLIVQASKTGIKYEDVNADGVFKAADGDLPLKDWTISAYEDNGDTPGKLDALDTFITSDMTDSNGEYGFNLDPGDYLILEENRAGWMQTQPGTLVNDGFHAALAANGYAITLASGQLDEDNDFGNFVKGSIHGYKFRDLNANGIDDDGLAGQGEEGLAGWRIFLDENDNGVLDWSDVISANGEWDPGEGERWTRTDANGEYWFTGLIPGMYRVREEQQQGFMRSTANPPDITILSGQEYVAVTGQAMLGTDDPREELTVGADLIFGNFEKGSIHALKFLDVNADGIYDPDGVDDIPDNDDDEVGLAGVEFTLTGTDGMGNPVGPIVETSMEDDDATPDVDETGLLWFTDLKPGTYSLTETIPDGYMTSTHDMDNNTASVTVTIVSGQEYAAVEGLSGVPIDPVPPSMKFETVDDRFLFGNFVKGSIHGIKFEDVDADGVQDPGEPLLDGVTINISGDNGFTDSTVTGMGGQFWFTGLAAGVTYTVTEDIPALATQTTPDPAPILVEPGFEYVANQVQADALIAAGLDPANVVTQPDLIFGNAFDGSIHGFKFKDLDADGIYDPDDGELPFPGVTFKLTGTDGMDQMVNASMDTNADGEFWFTGLLPGEYTVREMLPPDAMASTPTERTFTVESRQELVWRDEAAMLDPGDPREEVNVDTDLMFGNFFKGSIHGYKFDDLNGNGIDDDEPRLEGVTITLSGDVDGDGSVDELVTVTSDDPQFLGEYWFTDLFPGTYTVTETPPDGSVPTTAPSVVVTIVSGEEAVAEDGQSGIVDMAAMPGALVDNGFDIPKFETLDPRLAFGNAFLGSIHGFKFEDVDGDGSYNAAGDRPVQSVSFRLTGSDGMGNAVDRTAVTDGDGEFWFTGLIPSDAAGYTVTEVVPAGWMASTPTTFTRTLTSGEELVALPGQAMLDPAVDPQTEVVIGAPLAFGNYRPGSIHGFKFNDFAADGVYDEATDPPLVGVMFTLTGNDGTGTPITPVSMTSDANGEFWFTGLAPGDYTVTETLPAGYFNTTPLSFSSELQSGQELVGLEGQSMMVTNTIERVSVSSFGVEGNGDTALSASISADGRFVAFSSLANNLVPGDTNGTTDVFVFDRQTRTIERVSVDSGGLEGNDGSASPSISADGRFVAFGSSASNLVSGDTNGLFDVFVFDRQTDTIERVSVDGTGLQANGPSSNPAISSDGRFVAFSSRASNLVSGDTNNAEDIFVVDRQTDTIERVSVDGTGLQANGGSFDPSISADGRFVAFGSFASNLVSGDTNNDLDIFVFDRHTDTIERVSVDSAGMQGNSGSVRPSISADGRFVAFESGASNLVAGDTNNVPDIFVFDRQTGMVERVSLNNDGVQGNVLSAEPSISADGRFVVFTSGASNLVSGDTNDDLDIFVFDRQTDTIERVSLDNAGVQANDRSRRPSISADGFFVAFDSEASNLVSGDTNDANDVFVVARPGIVEIQDDGLRFGNALPGSIHGFKFNDLDGDGQFDPGERGVEDITFKLTGDVDGDSYQDTLYETTDEYGFFWFTDLFPGDYQVEEVLPPGTFPSGPPSVVVTIVSGQERVAVDGQAGDLDPPKFETQDDSLLFGNFVPPEVHGTKFHDRNANGIWDKAGEDGYLYTADDEVGLAGWTIRLDGFDGMGNEVHLQTVTDAQGRYWFMDDPYTPEVELPPGEYTITEVLQQGWLQSAPVDGKHEVTLESRDALFGRDFGNFLIGKNLLIVPELDSELVDLSRGDVWLSLDTSGGGLYEALATYNAAAGSVKMSLYDSELNLIAGSDDGDGDERVTWFADGDFYLLRVYGTNPAVDLTVGFVS